LWIASFWLLFPPWSSATYDIHFSTRFWKEFLFWRARMLLSSHSFLLHWFLIILVESNSLSMTDVHTWYSRNIYKAKEKDSEIRHHETNIYDTPFVENTAIKGLKIHVGGLFKMAWWDLSANWAGRFTFNEVKDCVIYYILIWTSKYL